MAHNNYESEDKQGTINLLEGIPVKISEKFKPPKKISVPSSILNKLNTDISDLEYNFQLEHSVFEKIGQWRQLRKTHAENRKQRLNQVNIKSPDPVVSAPSNSFPILTPIPIIAPKNISENSISNCFNIAEFEQDTSSPFDNMELKTINELEELAHVLQPTLCSADKETSCRQNGLTKYNSSNLDAYTNWSLYNHNYSSGLNLTNQNLVQESNLTYSGLPSQNPMVQSYVVQRVNSKKQTDMASESQCSKSVPDILQELQSELQNKRAESYKKKILPKQSGLEENNIPKTVSMLPNPISQLSLSSQHLCHRLAEMGFPIARVARAAEMFGDEEGRILEFLLQVQSLEEKNFSPDRAERALIINNYKESETVECLQIMCQLLDLGFREEKVIQALAQFGNNRDEVLDSLIS